MSNFEKKFGKYAIKNLSLMLVICYAFGYLIETVNPHFINFLTLNPHMIIRGQIWRLFTWIIIPPNTSSILTVIIMCFFYYSIGTTLERTWGTYLYNVYIFSGILFTIAGSFIAYGVNFIYLPLKLGTSLPMEAFAVAMESSAVLFSTYYVNMSIFLAFAATFPEAQVLLMFIIPIKVKYLGVLYGIMVVWDFAVGVNIEYYNVSYRIAILASLMNFIVFYIRTRRGVKLSKKQMKTRKEFREQSMQPRRTVTKHKCAICGRTEEMDPEMEFRFCSKCNGNYEYCREHLFTHEHIK